MAPETKTNRHRTWPPSTGFRRRTASAVSREDLPWRYHTKVFPWDGAREGLPWDGVTQRPSMDGPSQAMAEPADGGQRATHPCHGRGKSRRNQIKASLRAFQRREVKVLGFGVKTRPRPQRMASRRYSVPFALVGAIGKACGEAWGVFFLGSPPGVLVCAPPVVVGVLAGLVCGRGSCVDCVHVLTVLMV